MTNNDSLLLNMATTVQALERGLDLLELVIQATEGLTLAELAQKLRVAPPTAFALASTLIGKGLLKKSGRPVYYLPGEKLTDLQPRPSHTLDLESFLAVREKIGAESLLLTKAIDGDALIKMRITVQRASVVETPDRLVPSPYGFASSLCILAFLSGEERDLYRRRYPFTMYGPPMWESERHLEEFLQNTAELGYCHPTLGHPPRIAIPIWGAGNTLWGSLGASFNHPISEKHIEETLRIMQQSLTNIPALS